MGASTLLWIGFNAVVLLLLLADLLVVHRGSQVVKPREAADTSDHTIVWAEFD